MERLTHVCDDGMILFHPVCLPDNEGVNIISIALNKDYTALNQIAARLAEYENAEESGLLLRMPCKVGDTVFAIEEEYEDMYDPCSAFLVIDEKRFELWMLIDIGKTIFTTREEAEAALQKMQEDKA